jgi:hypothetical protein
MCIWTYYQKCIKNNFKMWKEIEKKLHVHLDIPCSQTIFWKKGTFYLTCVKRENKLSPPPPKKKLHWNLSFYMKHINVPFPQKCVYEHWMSGCTMNTFSKIIDSFKCVFKQWVHMPTSQIGYYTNELLYVEIHIVNLTVHYSKEDKLNIYLHQIKS